MAIKNLSCEVFLSDGRDKQERILLLAEEVAEDGLYRAYKNGRTQEYSAERMDAAYAETGKI